MMKLFAFLLSVAAGATLCSFGFLLSYDFFTSSNREVPYSYSEFLLENIAEPRIVIDAGSSSMWGIEPGLIEQAFGKTAIDVADNGAIPLDMKIYRLRKFAREGDTLIVPLEWVYYTREGVPQDFTDKTPDEYAAYYSSQPFWTRLAFAVGHASLHNLSDAGRLYLRKDLQQTHYARMQADMSKWPRGDRKDDRRRRSSVEGINCADYIAATGNIVTGVEWAAKQLSDLQIKRRLRVYVTWPAVAGSDCYEMASGHLPIAEQVRAVFERYGITVVGEPADSYFTAEHMLDTYYHVDGAAARVRTERLVSSLRDAGLKPDGADDNATALLASEATRKFETHFRARLGQLAKE
jgi:hypothetical protein